MNDLVELMRHKRWIDGSYLELATSATLEGKPELQRELLYWLNHIHIVDQIFYCHLIGKAHGFSSTVSDEVPEANDLRECMLDLDESLIALSEQLNSHAAAASISFRFTDGADGRMTRSQMLLHLSTHGLYHLAVSGAHLTKKGIAIPPMLLTTMLQAS
ncbi:TPA: hypothetical protein UMV35_000283 [Stenotrophomonas maltophilia]|nr:MULTISPECIES: DinB family protein [Stenotrophomonas]MBH1590870.1 hypothetical protein [Stenotrophomonas maltophilia]MDH2021709.1 hypothetical protein [Stenotrophomonas sp. GD03680]HDS1321634.1 hypothetical protein [Stenotrophomonas maltophilia]HDS1326243.1 hypothetical protein [Stenotrophomonas maltophilia]HDS1330949.1 hypothetical protein [Stenotrophomonas maltophilia]